MSSATFRPFYFRPVVVLALGLSALTAQAAPVNVDLPEQPLLESIQQLANASGLTVSIDSTLVADKTASALKGSFEPADAMHQLLQNSGLSATIEGGRAIIAKPSSDVIVREILVTAKKSNEGHAEEGYRVDAPHALGPLGSEKLLDIPNSMVILPADLIENVQATSLKEVLKYIPLAQFQEQQGPEVLRPATRGMQGSNYQNTRLDGMTVFVTGPNPVESLQQIEVFSGIPAAIYGPSNPAGVFNFISKRPTDETLAKVDVGYDSSSIYTVHADLGGKTGNGVIGYRVNLLKANGSGYVDDSETDRKMASIALDVHPTDSTTVELNYDYYNLKQTGYPGWFTFGQTTRLPDAPDPTKVGYGQSYAGVDMQNRLGSIRLLQDLGTNWHFVAGILKQGVDRSIDTPMNALNANNSGNYTSTLASSYAPHFGTVSNIAYLNGVFNTGEISHDLTLGTTGFRAETNSAVISGSYLLRSSGSMTNPVVSAQPLAGLPNFTNQYLSSLATQQGINFSDTIKFSKEWSVKLALSQDWMWTQNYSTTGTHAPTTKYSAHGLSPMPSLIYKPLENVTTYLTYASSLQQGDIATSGINNGQQMAPYRSYQTEVGVKLALSNLDLSMALFKLERPYAPLVTSTQTQTLSGQQENDGLEVTAVGKLVDDLVIYGGVTVLDPTMQNTGKTSTNGKQYVGMPKVRSNVLLEYHVPALSGLVATADWQYTGRRAVDDANLFWTPSYSVLDLGARYTLDKTSTWGKPTTLRFAVLNVTDEHYWSTVGPSTITGANSGSMTAHLGAPRTIAASMTIDF